MLHKFTRFSAISFALLLSQLIFASEYPGGCVGGGYNFQNNYLFVNDSGQQTIFMIQNKGPVNIELERVQTKDAFMSPTLTTVIASGSWAAFASDAKNLPFECHRIDGDTKVNVDCSQYIDLCHYPHVVFAASNMGTYWVSTNKNRADVIKDSVATGIYLKW